MNFYTLVAFGGLVAPRLDSFSGIPLFWDNFGPGGLYKTSPGWTDQGWVLWEPTMEVTLLFLLTGEADNIAKIQTMLHTYNKL